MTTKHTQGPWTYTDHRDRRHRSFAIMSSSGSNIDGGSGLIANCWAGSGCHFSWAQQFANARLIAAAPELLAACEGIVASFHESAIDESGFPALSAVIRAIKKAKGE